MGLKPRGQKPRAKKPPAAKTTRGKKPGTAQKARARRPFATVPMSHFDTQPDVEIWHNPRCQKSRETLDRIRAKGVEPIVREYLNRGPSLEELEKILEQLAFEPRDLIREKEEAYQMFGLDKEDVTREELLKAMVDHPILIERPIVIRGERAVLARPPENVDLLF